MLQLVYVSTPSSHWDGDLAALCLEASNNNLRDEITGVLLHADGSFLQVLEGPKATVEDAFIRIITDPRHHSLALLSRKMVTRREFGEWAMAGMQSPEEKQATIAHVAHRVGHDTPNAQQAFSDRFGVQAAN